MSSVVLPSRGKCIHITDDSQHCQCLWFFPPASPLLDQNICGHCGHGVHAHADYVSTVVNHYPANQCVAYAQKTHLTQRCTCGTQLCKHIGAYNSYRIPEPSSVLRYFDPDTNSPSPSIATSNDTDTSFSPNTTPSSNYSSPMFSDDATDTSLTPAPIPSPSASNASSAIQPDTSQTLGYSPDSSFAQYPNYFINSAYTGPPEGGATNESFEYQGYGNVMYAEPSEDWLGSYGA